MAKKLKKNDHVTWSTPQGETAGHVVRKLTRPTKIGEHQVAASKDDPEYLVESERSGKRAAHRPEALTKN